VLDGFESVSAPVVVLVVVDATLSTVKEPSEGGKASTPPMKYRHEDDTVAR